MCDFFRLGVKPKPTTPPPAPPSPVADRRHKPFALEPSRRLPHEGTDPVVNRNWRPWEPSASQQESDTGAQTVLEGEVADREWIPWEPDPPDQPPDPDPPQAITDPDVDRRWRSWQAIRKPEPVQPAETRPPLTWVIEEDDEYPHPIPDRGSHSASCAAFAVVVAAVAAIFL
ncbi:hypothetical protein AAVH_38646 [Aphelenchoides avenae]|nr:hypothetical protein AAVH_38646 [Aphelenchus avenae]